MTSLRAEPVLSPSNYSELETAESYQAARAVWEAVCGNAAEGKRNAMAALVLSNGPDAEYAAGLALALSGDFSRSEALAGDLDKSFPEDTFVNLLTYRFFEGHRHWGVGSPQTAESVCKRRFPMSWR